MNVNKFMRRLLKLKGLKVKDFYFSNYNKELHIIVKPYKNGCLCPICYRRCMILTKAKDDRSWKDITVCKTTIYFHYHPKEILCPTHGRVQEMIPWSDNYSRITYRLEYLILRYAQMMTQKEASFILDMAASTFSDLLHRAIESIREGHRIRNLRSIGVDEVSYKKKMKYATVVYDLDKCCVVWVGKGKGKSTICRFFKKKLSEFQKNNIQWASCDMSEGYINAIKENCPNATLVLDRFHIAKALNEAVDEVRKEQWRQVSDKERKVLKGLRWLLFKHSNNRSKRDSRILNKLYKYNRRIHRAWVLKDEFEQLWDYAYRGVAERFLKGWITTVLKSRLDPIKKIAKTIRKYSENIISYLEKHITNAVAEGLNRVIKLVNSRASGFRTFNAFSDMVYLNVGDLDIPAQIPNKFRTL